MTVEEWTFAGSALAINPPPGLRLLNARTSNGTDGYGTWRWSKNAEFQVCGTFNGANIVLYVLGADGSTDIPVKDSSGATFTITGAGTYSLDMVPYQQVKATIASAGASTSLTAHLLDKGGC